jgi:hypothetical protein
VPTYAEKNGNGAKIAAAQVKRWAVVKSNKSNYRQREHCTYNRITPLVNHP